MVALRAVWTTKIRNRSIVTTMPTNNSHPVRSVIVR